ncbi:AGAP010631-PA, partial [Anopheles gambiae str. PEST]
AQSSLVVCAQRSLGLDQWTSRSVFPSSYFLILYLPTWSLFVFVSVLRCASAW